MPYADFAKQHNPLNSLRRHIESLKIFRTNGPYYKGDVISFQIDGRTNYTGVVCFNTQRNNCCLLYNRTPANGDLIDSPENLIFIDNLQLNTFQSVTLKQRNYPIPPNRELQRRLENTSSRQSLIFLGNILNSQDTICH